MLQLLTAAIAQHCQWCTRTNDMSAAQLMSRSLGFGAAVLLSWPVAAAATHCQL
jgi:hypothetical protein